MVKNRPRLPYIAPDASVFILSPEQNIATGSADNDLSDMGAVDIFDDPFTPIV